MNFEECIEKIGNVEKVIYEKNKGWYENLRRFALIVDKYIRELKEEILNKDSLKDYENDKKIKEFLISLLESNNIGAVGSIGSTQNNYLKKPSEADNTYLENLYEIVRDITRKLNQISFDDENSLEDLCKSYEDIIEKSRVLNKTNNNRLKAFSLRLFTVLDNFEHFSSFYSEKYLREIQDCFNLDLQKRDILINREMRKLVDNKYPKLGKIERFKLPWILYEECCKKENGKKFNGIENIEKNKQDNKKNTNQTKMDCNTNLKIDKHIFRSFYNSLKTKGFVILAGLSGTGKTKIFEEFVKCFPEDKSLFFPIRPDFKDTKSLLGFYNPLENKYHSTPLLNFIQEASKNYLEKGKDANPFFVLFDEMNLARVEYYFADFLSVLEAKRFETKKEAIQKSEFQKFIEHLGFEEDAVNENNFKFTSQSIKLHNGKDLEIPQEIFLPPNLYFVGTVNIDETTHMFSPKVLDRAFTIEFDVGSFDDYLEFLKKQFENNTDRGNSESSYTNDALRKDFTNEGNFAVVDKRKIYDFFNEKKEYKNKLQQINEVLKNYNLHFGYRVFDEIGMFLYNCQNSYFKFENLDEAFDLAIKMKVLPKFHGTRQRLEKPILEFLKLLDTKLKNVNNSESENDIEIIYENLERIPKIKENSLKLKLNNEEKEIETLYIHTTHKLLEMLYRLKTEGFASFI